VTIPVDRGAPPPPGARRPPELPAFERDFLPNGLELLIAPRPAIPLVEAALLLPAGGERNPSDRPGLAALVAALVDEGSDRRNGFEITSEVERLGGALSTHADWNGAQLDISILAEDLERGLEIVREVASAPSFPVDQLERIRRQTITELERRRDQPALLAEEALADALYAGTAYAHLSHGSVDSLRAIGRDEVTAFHAAHYCVAGSHLVLVGDVDSESARASVARIFGDWRTPAPAAPPPIEPAPSARRVIVVDRPEGAQTELRIGHVGTPRTDPDRTRLGVLNSLLGGKFTSRLNLNLRERHGFTYGVNSRFVDRRGPGPFVVAAAVGNDVVGAAATETLAELSRIREEAVTTIELEETKSYLVGVFPYTLQTNGGLLARLSDLALYALPSDHLERALREVLTTTREQILALAQRHLAPERAAIVAVGPAETLARQLEPFGAVEVRTPD
jgi:zinc protease